MFLTLCGQSIKAQIFDYYLKNVVGDVLEKIVAKSGELMENQALPKVFDINTVLIIIMFIAFCCSFGFVFYQIHMLTMAIDKQTISVNEFQQPVNFNSPVVTTEPRLKGK